MPLVLTDAANVVSRIGRLQLPPLPFLVFFAILAHPLPPKRLRKFRDCRPGSNLLVLRIVHADASPYFNRQLEGASGAARGHRLRRPRCRIKHWQPVMPVHICGPAGAPSIARACGNPALFTVCVRIAIRRLRLYADCV